MLLSNFCDTFNVVTNSEFVQTSKITILTLPEFNTQSLLGNECSTVPSLLKNLTVTVSLFKLTVFSTLKTTECCVDGFK
jgi:hypothetical protein